ncbi:gluconokinase [Sphingomonas bacterium]|uniref:gluconokinase n=1 Tax=Sphingomonas bacterium TaxID=1895847 RepID=UPI001576E8A0|nr:gluconokinase [Sphingomonas bacterium]
MPIVVMGVSGAGKTEVGRRLAAMLGVPFCEGDALHPAANIARMAAGIALTDEDRAPWLDRVAAWLADHPTGVAACSALRRAYRDRLRGSASGPKRETLFVLLDVPEALLRARMLHRPGHFMPASLLDSQLATLERPGADEWAIVVPVAGDAQGTAAVVAGRVSAAGPA